MKIMKIDKIQIQYNQPIIRCQVSIDVIPKNVYYEKNITREEKFILSI